MLIRCHVCDKVESHWARGLCRPCYNRLRYHAKHKEFSLTSAQIKESKKKLEQWRKESMQNAPRCLKCEVGIVKSRGLCEHCYQQACKDGELDDDDLNYSKTPEQTELFVALKRLERKMSWEMPKFATEGL